MKYLQFSSIWCEPCKMLTPIIEQVKATGIPVEKIDVDSNPDISARFGIRSVPTVILIDNSGNEVKRSIGVQTADFYISNFK